MNNLTQQARDILERAGVEKAQNMTSGDLGEIVNLLRDRTVLRQLSQKVDILHDYLHFGEASPDEPEVSPETAARPGDTYETDYQGACECTEFQIGLFVTIPQLGDVHPLGELCYDGYERARQTKQEPSTTLPIGPHQFPPYEGDHEIVINSLVILNEYNKVIYVRRFGTPVVLASVGSLSILRGDDEQ